MTCPISRSCHLRRLDGQWGRDTQGHHSQDLPCRLPVNPGHAKGSRPAFPKEPQASDYTIPLTATADEELPRSQQSMTQLLGNCPPHLLQPRSRLHAGSLPPECDRGTPIERGNHSLGGKWRETKQSQGTGRSWDKQKRKL